LILLPAAVVRSHEGDKGQPDDRGTGLNSDNLIEARAYLTLDRNSPRFAGYCSG